jgi:hypothetical protein
MDALSTDVKADIIELLAQHDVVRASVFGSFARGTQNEHSDFDILVEFAGEKGLLDLVALKLHLQDLLGRDVDVVTYRALHPKIKERVLKEQVALL